MCFIGTYTTHYKTRGNKKERTDNKDKVDEPIWQCVRVYMCEHVRVYMCVQGTKAVRAYYVPGIFLVCLFVYSLSLNLDVLRFPKASYSVAYLEIKFEGKAFG